MATINGNSNFPQNDTTISSTIPGKRKRSESADESLPKFTSGATKQVNAFSQRLRNALPILRKVDQASSLLDHPLTQSGEPSPKRPKYLLDKAGNVSISSRIESGYYHSPDDLLGDTDNAAASLIKSLRTGQQTLNDPDSTSKAINQVTLFKQSLGRVCRQLGDLDAKAKVENGVEESSLPSGTEEVTKPSILTLTSQTDRGPKTLYSGLQHKTNTPATRTGFTTENLDDLPHVDFRSLPNGISTTQVPPSNAPSETSSSKQKRAFSEVFRPHRSLKALEPPRPSRNATRGSILGWVNPEELSGSDRPIPAYKSDHRYTSLPTGSWLHYNSVEASTAAGSDNKRRQRDRALSFGESRAEAVEDTAEYEHAKTKALFQSAYSSFAPTVDNSTAVVPEKTRSRAWWSKIGQKRFEALLSLQYPEIDTNRSDFISSTMHQANDDFEAVVADFEEEIFETPLEDHAKDADTKDVDEILQEISDLLQTLTSYQRIRNLSKGNSGPASPTSAEADVYEVLRSGLSILISSLPPYAVAKLGGDQLEMLNVSTKIVIDARDHVGTMAADEYSLQRPRVSMAATQPTSARPSVSVGAAGRPGNYTAQSLSYNPRLNYANVPRTPYSNQSRPIPAHGVSGTPQPLNYPASRPAPTPSQRAGLPAQPHYSNQSYSQGPNASRYQRPLSGQPNGYGPSYAQTVNSQAYAQQRQNQSSYSYSAHQPPQKSMQSPQPVVQVQQQYSAQPQLLRNQASPPTPHTINSQGSTVEQLRNQLQAQRQLSSTPQTAHTNGQYAQLARSSTPGGGLLNGRPTVTAGSTGQ